jgi:selenocysteine lyase/cysteine desulfurase
MKVFKVMTKQNSSTYKGFYSCLDTKVPTLDGSTRKYINFDNAASTPSLKFVKDKVNQYLEYYSSVHRGTGFKSLISTHAYEEARRIVMDFVGANSEDHICLFGKNTTEAINILAHRYPFTPEKNIVLVSSQEHHSNDLPWRAVAKVVHIGLRADGSLDEADFDLKLKIYGERVALVSITGASNVTGFINPLHRLAEKTHQAGALICADCAQLAPHRSVDMRSLDDPTHLDFISISAHKMYAPFGTGALISRKDTFETGEPYMQGGGEVEIVTLDEVTWSAPPDRDEAGSPNTVGAIALAAAISQLNAIGMDQVAQHEAELTTYLLTKLNGMQGVTIYGSRSPETAVERLGVVPINLDGMSHYLVAAILGYEFGIGVRNGCFCAHPYLLKLMDVDETNAKILRNRIQDHDKRDVPGLVRISFGLYNTKEEIDVLISALQAILDGKYHGKYHQETQSGAFFPEGWNVNYEEHFSLGLDGNGR